MEERQKREVRKRKAAYARWKRRRQKVMEGWNAGMLFADIIAILQNMEEWLPTPLEVLSFEPHERALLKILTSQLQELTDRATELVQAHDNVVDSWCW
jgi:hypothetical protein